MHLLKRNILINETNIFAVCATWNDPVKGFNLFVHPLNVNYEDQPPLVVNPHLGFVDLVQRHR
jgi:hypothetical protein